MLSTFDPIKNQEKKNVKRKSKIQDDIQKEILEDYPSWW
jgi:hypothetical protein